MGTKEQIKGISMRIWTSKIHMQLDAEFFVSNWSVDLDCHISAVGWACVFRIPFCLSFFYAFNCASPPPPRRVVK